MTTKTTKNWGPEYDQKIYQKFSMGTLKNKTENKLALQNDLGLPVSKRTFVVAISSELSEKHGAQLFEKALPGLLSIPCQILVRAVGTERYQKLIMELIEKHPQRVRVMEDSEENVRKMYAASDAILVLQKGKEEEVADAMAYGAVPVGLPQEKLENYDAVEESGNSFLAYEENEWGLFAAFVRAYENFRFPYDWNNLQKNAMATVKGKEEENLEE